MKTLNENMSKAKLEELYESALKVRNAVISREVYDFACKEVIYYQNLLKALK